MPTTTDGKYFEYTKAGLAAANAHQIRINKKRQNMGEMKGGPKGYNFKATTENVRDATTIKLIKHKYGSGHVADVKLSENEQRIKFGGFGHPFSETGRRNMKENFKHLRLGGGLELPRGYKEVYPNPKDYDLLGRKKKN